VLPPRIAAALVVAIVASGVWAGKKEAKAPSVARIAFWSCSAVTRTRYISLIGAVLCYAPCSAKPEEAQAAEPL